MEFHSTDVIQMPEQCKETPTEFIVPNLNFVSREITEILECILWAREGEGDELLLPKIELTLIL
jgi:hypothetical protein